MFIRGPQPVALRPQPLGTQQILTTAHEPAAGVPSQSVIRTRHPAPSAVPAASTSMQTIPTRPVGFPHTQIVNPSMPRKCPARAMASRSPARAQMGPPTTKKRRTSQSVCPPMPIRGSGPAPAGVPVGAAAQQHVNPAHLMNSNWVRHGHNSTAHQHPTMKPTEVAHQRWLLSATHKGHGLNRLLFAESAPSSPFTELGQASGRGGNTFMGFNPSTPL